MGFQVKRKKDEVYDADDFAVYNRIKVYYPIFASRNLQQPN